MTNLSPAAHWSSSMTTKPPINECLVAYWDNQRFGNSLIDAPERMQAVFDVLAEWCDQLCYSDTAQRFKESSGRVDG
jgi:hypothetical protein